MSLLSKVKRHCTTQATSNQATLAMTVECIDHMFGPSGDWTPLAWLLMNSQPAQKTRVKAIVRRCVQGWSFSEKDGRFSKIKGKNQGVDSALLDTFRRYVDAKTSIQSKDEGFVTALRGEKPAPKDFDPKAWAERTRKQHDNPADLDQMIAALQAVRAKMIVSEPAH